MHAGIDPPSVEGNRDSAGEVYLPGLREDQSRPDDINALKEALIIERVKALEVTAELAVARAKASEDVALIAQQKLRIAKLERQVYGQRSERSARLVDQLALEFEELEASATEDEIAAEQAVARTTVRGFTRQRSVASRVHANEKIINSVICGALKSMVPYFIWLSRRSWAAMSVADFASRSLPAYRPSEPPKSTPHRPMPKAR